MRTNVSKFTKNSLNNLVKGVTAAKQVECPVNHYFGPNIYIREIIIPAGTVIVGKYHKENHLCNMIEGQMVVVDDDGARKEFKAPCVFVAKKGRKIAYVLKTVRFQNIFSTPETDIEKLENMLVEDNPPLLQKEGK